MSNQLPGWRFLIRDPENVKEYKKMKESDIKKGRIRKALERRLEIREVNRELDEGYDTYDC